MERLQTFSPYELQLLLCGEQAPSWSRDDILNYTEPKYGYNRDRYPTSISDHCYGCIPVFVHHSNPMSFSRFIHCLYTHASLLEECILCSDSVCIMWLPLNPCVYAALAMSDLST